MKETPLIMCGEMVRAYQADLKTMTRRLINCSHEIACIATPAEWNAGRAHPNMKPFEDWGPQQGLHLFRATTGTVFAMKCPYGGPGDRLLIKEAYQITCFDPDDPQWQVSGYYLADGHAFNEIDLTEDEWARLCARKYPTRPTPGMFMYKSLIRHRPEITSVRPERLQDISEEDAIAEGSQIPIAELPKSCRQGAWTERQAFSRIWDFINGKKHPWANNDWVWAIGFKRIER